jgi:hypothetical protein
LLQQSESALHSSLSTAQLTVAELHVPLGSHAKLQQSLSALHESPSAEHSTATTPEEQDPLSQMLLQQSLSALQGSVSRPQLCVDAQTPPGPEHAKLQQSSSTSQASPSA